MGTFLLIGYPPHALRASRRRAAAAPLAAPLLSDGATERRRGGITALDDLPGERRRLAQVGREPTEGGDEEEG